MSALPNNGAEAPGPVTPGSDEALAGGTAQGFQEGTTDTRDSASAAPLVFMIVRHDDDCPMLLPTPGRCACEPVPELVSESRFTATVGTDLRRRRDVAQAAALAVATAKAWPGGAA